MKLNQQMEIDSLKVNVSIWRKIDIENQILMIHRWSIEETYRGKIEFHWRYDDISNENETNIRPKFKEEFTLAIVASISFDDEWHQQLARRVMYTEVWPARDADRNVKWIRTDASNDFVS